MKIYEVEIKNETREKINEISKYIYRTSFSKEIAYKNYDMIYKEIFSLKIFPYRFPMFNENYRVFTIDKKYRVFYKIDEEQEKIIVARIFSSYENYYTEDFLA